MNAFNYTDKFLGKLADKFIDEIIMNTKNNIMFNRINNNNFIIESEPNSLVSRYFSHLKDGRYAANNGFVLVINYFIFLFFFLKFK